MNTSGKLLIVEDDFLVALDAETVSSALGFEPVVTDAAQEAIALVQKMRFAAAILDFQVRDGDTADVAEALAEAGIPYVVVSGEDRSRIEDRGISLSCVVSKPVDYGRIIPSLQTAQ